MKRLTARKTQECSVCRAEIEREEEYYGNSYSAFCIECGKKKLSGGLTFDNKKKKFITAVIKTKCEFCADPPVHLIDGHSVCKIHVGEILQ